jgi:hypothetical protein
MSSFVLVRPGAAATAFAAIRRRRRRRLEFCIRHAAPGGSPAEESPISPGRAGPARGRAGSDRTGLVLGLGRGMQQARSLSVSRCWRTDAALQVAAAAAAAVEAAPCRTRMTCASSSTPSSCFLAPDGLAEALHGELQPRCMANEGGCCDDAGDVPGRTGPNLWRPLLRYAFSRTQMIVAGNLTETQKFPASC